jgi:heme exporter protein D
MDAGEQRSSEATSGPALAWLFQRALAAIQAVAFASLAAQVLGLIGSRGLLPWAQLNERLQTQAISFWRLPTLLRFATSDGALTFGAWLGVGLSLLALAGLWPRALLAVNALLYLSFMNAGGVFFGFQWDILLIESSLLAALLPADRESRLAHLACRILLFKLYFESGIAKVLSPDWLAWFAHHLPRRWHRFESSGALVLELLVPLFIFGPRTLRRVAFVAFTGFQVLNLATANYGFFVYLALALHLFLLADADLPIARAVKSSPGRRGPLPAALLGAYVLVSVIEAGEAFAPGWVPAPATALVELTSRFSAVNVFHLFGSITTERLEPTVELRQGEHWSAQQLKHKPGDPSRAPDLVAPHQPRMDFQLWFYGLSPESTPEYVAGLLLRLCTDPDAVAAFFAAPLPAHPDAARITFARYTYTSAEERARSGRWWNVGPASEGPTLECSRVRPPLPDEAGPR